MGGTLVKPFKGDDLRVYERIIGFIVLKSIRLLDTVRHLRCTVRLIDAESMVYTSVMSALCFLLLLSGVLTAPAAFAQSGYAERNSQAHKIIATDHAGEAVTQ